MTGKPDDQHTRPRGAFRRRLESGEFAVTAEIGPPRGADLVPVTEKATALRDWVDAVNITDNQGAAVRLSSLAGSLAAKDAGVEPIMQVTCRDRNRIALQSDLLGAAALGIPNVVIMTGDHPRYGDHTGATPVFDLDSPELLRVATAMRDEGRLMAGGALTPPPDWLLGAVENLPRASDGLTDPVSTRLVTKIEAGAQFVQTQFVFDVPAFAAWVGRLRDAGLTERCHILAGVGPVRSPRALAHLTKVPGVFVPDDVVARLLAAGPDHFRAEGERLCSEIIAALDDVPGLAGVHVMAIGAERTIPGILRNAGLAPRRVTTGTSDRPGAGS
jgi:methylenetetrahydrofolate reductase (NADPH)